MGMSFVFYFAFSMLPALLDFGWYINVRNLERDHLKLISITFGAVWKINFLIPNHQITLCHSQHVLKSPAYDHIQKNDKTSRYLTWHTKITLGRHFCLKNSSGEFGHIQPNLIELTYCDLESSSELIPIIHIWKFWNVRTSPFK